MSMEESTLWEGEETQSFIEVSLFRWFLQCKECQEGGKSVNLEGENREGLGAEAVAKKEKD